MMKHESLDTHQHEDGSLILNLPHEKGLLSPVDRLPASVGVAALLELSPALSSLVPVLDLTCVKRLALKVPDCMEDNSYGHAFQHDHRGRADKEMYLPKNQSHLWSSRIRISSPFSRASLALRALAAASSPTRYGSSRGLLRARSRSSSCSFRRPSTARSAPWT